MQRLILLRHGKAESAPASGGDFERGLTDRGRRDAALMGRVLANAGVKIDRVLVSSARRAVETWEEVAAEFPKAEVDIDRMLYLASAEQLARMVGASNAACLMIIGHNPGLHELAATCAGHGRALAGEALVGSFPTAAAAVFGKDADGDWVLEHLLTPRAHGGGVL